MPSDLVAVVGQVEANTDAPLLVAQNIGFGVIAALMIYGGIRLVTTRDVVHAALYLVVVLAGVAAQYVLLAAEFIAAVQVLVYIGAIVVLFLFGVMLTRARIGGEAEMTRRSWQGGVLVSVILLGLLGYVLIDWFGESKLPTEIDIGTADAVSDSIFGTFLVPFEIVSVLLTAALIGAIVIARRD